MANFTQKAGYQNLMDWDPSSGILKYGNYEHFIDQIPEINPQSQKVTFQGWKQDYINSLRKSGTQSMMGGMFPMNMNAKIPSDAELRTIFDSTFKTGEYVPTPPKSTVGASVFGIPAIGNIESSTPMYRKVTKLGADEYQVDDYAVPGDVKLLYKMNELASQTTQVTEDTALMQEQKATKQARVANRNAGVGNGNGNGNGRPGVGAAMLGGSVASRSLAGG